MNKSAFHKLSYGVYAITAQNGTRSVGCIANSAMQITSTPPSIAVSINKDNFTHSVIQKTKKFAISILSEQTDPVIIGTFGFQSSRDTDKFTTIAYEIQNGLPILQDICAWFTVEVTQQMDASTHTVFLGTVTDCEICSNTTPMTYAYYHAVLKGKSPKAAPTYLEETEQLAVNSKNRYVCTICGYIYEGESLPTDFVCPICKQPVSAFQLLS